MRIRPEDFNKLIGHIYDAAASPDLWQDFLENLGNILNAASASWRVLEPGRPSESMSITWGYDKEQNKAYREYYIKTDPFLPILHSLPAGTIINSSEIFTEREFRKTEAYNGFFKDQDKFYFAGGFVVHEGERALQVAVQRSRGAGPYDREDLDLLRMLVPHLKRAADINLKFSDLKAALGSSESVVDQLSAGAILIDGQMRVKWMNRSAQRLLDQNDQLLIRTDRLVAAQSQDHQRLVNLLKQALSPAGARGGCMQIMPNTSQSLVLTVAPLSENISGPLPPIARAMAVVFLNSVHQPCAAMDIERLRELFRLTEAEARLAIEIANGHELREICRNFDISIHTGRSQLKAIFQKTGVRRQAELVKLLHIFPNIIE